MRLGILLLILIAVVFGSGFWYEMFNPICKTPVEYRIGSIDERFGTSKEELKRIAKDAENIWEAGTGEDLFVYADDGKLPINLVFDDRQENADLERELRADIGTKEGMSDSVAAQYDTLIAQFRSLKESYEKEVLAYETRLKAYNAIVTEWNQKGGVPPHELASLKEEQNALTSEQNKLESRARELNDIVTKLNQIGAKGNLLISDYNEIVNEYNQRFSESHEFTQGDHTIDAINIYQFNSEEELTLVIAHEMGHALSLGHVENDESLMYRLMGNQHEEDGLSPEDLAEYEKVCKNKNFIEDLIALFQNAF